jgi:ribonuclease VapC
MVVDTSIILAIFFNETHGEWAAMKLNEYSGEICMSTVNLAESCILIRDRLTGHGDEIIDQLLAAGIRFVPPDVNQARIAADARLRFPLNLGDCFVYALAATEDQSILTLDEDFRSVDRDVVLP